MAYPPNGVASPQATATITVSLNSIPRKDLNLIADRLYGIDVCQLWNSNSGTTKALDERNLPVLVKADAPDYEALIAAVRADQEEVESRQTRHRELAIGMAEQGIDSVGALRSELDRQADVQKRGERSWRPPA
jgi:hypothetical protein